MIHRLTDHLIEHWDAIVGGRLPRPSAIHLLKFGSVTDFPRKYVYLYAFLDHAGEPALVLKITADRAAQTQLVREFDVLHRIRARVTPEVAATIPEALAGLPFGAFWIGVEEVAGGQRFVPVIDLERRDEGRRVADVTRRVLDWMVSFGRCGAGRQAFTGELYAAAVSEPLAQLRAYYELEPEEVAYLDELAERLASWRERPIGTVALHGDFWPGNIYLADDGLRVIDWSGFRERDASYHDLFNFLGSFVVVRGTVDARTVYYGHQSEGDSLLLPPAESGWLQEIAAAFADQYIRRLELDRDVVQLLLPMYYVAMATRREPVNEASVAVNHKFRGLLGAYIRKARAAGGFSLPGPWGAGAGAAPAAGCKRTGHALPGCTQQAL